jgi:hypothetical protein
MPRRLLPISIAVAAVISACSLGQPRFAERGITPARWCVPDSGIFGDVTVGKLRWTLISSDPSAAELREGLQRMPKLTPGEVTLVMDEAMCERAARAVAAQYLKVSGGDAARLEPVILLSAGPRWIAVPRDTHAGEFAIGVFLERATYRFIEALFV